LVRVANRDPIQSEFDALFDAGLIVYVPFATTITSTVLSASELRRAGIDVTVTDLTDEIGAGTGV